MANIDLTPELSDALRVRLSNEYGQICATNFALDIVVEALQIEVQRLRDHVLALQERVAKQDTVIEEQKIALGSEMAVRRQKMRECYLQRGDLEPKE